METLPRDLVYVICHQINLNALLLLARTNNTLNNIISNWTIVKQIKHFLCTNTIPNFYLNLIDNLFIQACHIGDLQLVKYLVSQGADIFAYRNNILKTSTNYQTNIVDYLTNNDDIDIELLVNYQAKIKYQDNIVGYFK